MAQARKAIAAAALIAAAGSTAACGRSKAAEGGPTVSRSYPVGAFDAIEVAGAYDVQVRTGANPSVSARGPEKMMERLVVEVRGNRLLIHSRKQKGFFNFGWSRHGGVKLEVTVPALRGATIAGSGDIAVDRVRGDLFEGEIAGSGGLKLGTVEVGELRLGVAGSGDVTAAGRARTARYEIAGSGEVDARSLATEVLRVSIAGSGDVRANATRAAEVEIMGSGDVEVTGGAKCSVSKAGSGDVRCS